LPYILSDVEECKKFVKNRLFVIFLLSFFIQAAGARLVDVYKEGCIKLNADPGFGKGTDWVEFFYDYNRQLAVGPDGNIFVVNSNQHNIFKFSPEGKMILKFGQLGQGPGDTYHPRSPSVLDDKYLVVDDYPEQRKINLFDLEGKFVNSLRTKNAPYFSLGLKNGKIAYMSKKLDPHLKTKTTTVFIKDCKSGDEITVETIERPYDYFIKDGITLIIGDFRGEVFLSKTKDGNLMLGVSNTPSIKIYSPGGRFLRSLKLRITPIPATNDYIQRYKEHTLKKLETSTARKRIPHYIRNIKSLPFASIFDKYLPYYNYLMTDNEGNILVFKTSACIGECEKIFQVYSPMGKYICETKIDEGIFNIPGDIRGKIAFTGQGILGLFDLKDSEDICLRLVKVNIN
jgi:hypothetical protein